MPRVCVKERLDLAFSGGRAERRSSPKTLGDPGNWRLFHKLQAFPFAGLPRSSQSFQTPALTLLVLEEEKMQSDQRKEDTTVKEGEKSVERTAMGADAYNPCHFGGCGSRSMSLNPA